MPLLELLRCPRTGQRLRIPFRIGVEDQHHIQEWLISEGGDWLYPVKNGIPILVPEEARASRPPDLQI